MGRGNSAHINKMATRKLTIHIDDFEIEIVLRSARKEDGIRRAELMMEAVSKDDKNTKNLLKQVAFYQYPSCVCCVSSPDYIREMSFGDFIKVDEADIDQWTIDANELNPQWKKTMQALVVLSDEEEKKTGTLLNGSLPLMDETMPSPEISPPLKS